LLESVEGSEKVSRYSLIGADPISKVICKEGSIKIDESEAECYKAYDVFKDHFLSFSCGSSDIAPFTGGFVGYIGYGMVREFEGIEQPADDLGIPDMCFMLPRHLICVDHLNELTYLISHDDIDDLKGSISDMDSIEECHVGIGERQPHIRQDEFEEIVRRAKESILDGEVFQVVPSRSVDFDLRGDPFQMYLALRSVNPSPYLFYMDFGETKLIGSSPEMLVRLEDGLLTTRPLAGTRPRHSNVEEDEKLKIDMLLDEKERAEHLMLVDLHRNDMGRVSRTGSVKVTELMNVEKFSHVQHIVSNIESEILPDRDAFDALKACFPAGTVTGAPKIRAMQLISELESRGRGPYAGAAGYFDFNGNMDFGIVIRSIVLKGERGRVQAGAGVVHDSVPSCEYLETERKMEALLMALSMKEGS